MLAEERLRGAGKMRKLVWDLGCAFVFYVYQTGFAQRHVRGAFGMDKLEFQKPLENYVKDSNGIAALSLLKYAVFAYSTNVIFLV